MKKPYFNNNYHSTLKTSFIAPNAESLEEKIKKAMSAGSPIEEISPIIYTERRDGVHPETDIRTDRQEIAIDATTKLTAHYAARRRESMEKVLKKETEEMQPAETKNE